MQITPVGEIGNLKTFLS